MGDFEKLQEEWPSKEKFYSSLTNKKSTDKVYVHDLNVWNKFEMKTMKDYHDLYLKRDVLLLANMFEKYRKLFIYLDTNNLCGIAMFKFLPLSDFKWISLT